AADRCRGIPELDAGSGCPGGSVIEGGGPWCCTRSDRSDGGLPLGGRGEARLPVALARGASSERSCAACQSWNVDVGGTRVSVIVVVGIPASFASLTWAATSGVEFWLLNTYTL